MQYKISGNVPATFMVDATLLVTELTVRREERREGRREVGGLIKAVCVCERLSELLRVGTAACFLCE